MQLALACDGIMRRLCAARKDTALAFLCTPTDNHVIPAAAWAGAKDSLARRAPAWARLLAPVLGLRGNAAPPIEQDDGGADVHIVDGLVVAQGPNYALAKRLQHWRAVLAHSEGHVVCSNVAPSTATKSVVHNAQFAAAYGGMHCFQPMEVMYQETSNAVMGALLIHDTQNPAAAANPASAAGRALANPMALFSVGGFHGGVWRCAYRINDIGVPSVLAYYCATQGPLLAAGGAALAVGAHWLAVGTCLPAAVMALLPALA